MITADGLNLDCLELIFAYLLCNDLVAVSLVSKSFLGGVIPRLYRTLFFNLKQAKRRPAILSPFASVLAHPNLASHVRHIDIRTVPLVKSFLNPEFLRDCSGTIAICKNLVSFICTPNVLPSFLPFLREKESLQYLRVNASLTGEQTEQLAKIRNLKSLTLDGGTTPVVNVLPSWTTNLKPTLTTLTFYAVHDLNDCVLETVLSGLLNLTGLHVAGKSVIYQLGISPPSTTVDTTSPSLKAPHCRHTLHPFSKCNARIVEFDYFFNSHLVFPLTSITLKLSDKLHVGDSFIQELLDAHESTLTHIALFNCALSLESVRSICTRCTELERFAVSIPVKDIHSFAGALSRSESIRTLSDYGDLHSKHGHKVFASRSDVRYIMELVPSLQKIITEGRVWTAKARGSGSRVDDGFELHIERKKSSPYHWFMPPSGTGEVY